MEFKKWSKSNTVQVRIKKELYVLLKKEAVLKEKSMYYILNQLLIDKFKKDV